MNRIDRRQILRSAFAAITPLRLFGEAEAPELYTVSEGYKVYSALLAHEQPRGEEVKLLVIQAETTGPDICLKPERESKPILGPAIKNYNNLIKTKWILAPELKLNTPYRLAPLTTLRRSLDGGTFSRDYPGSSGGYFALSPVGLNESKTVAVVSVAYWCGGNCMSGNFRVLRKKDNQWSPLSWQGFACEWAA